MNRQTELCDSMTFTFTFRGLKKKHRTDGPRTTDGWTDGWTDGPTDQWIDRQTDPHIKTGGRI